MLLINQIIILGRTGNRYLHGLILLQPLHLNQRNNSLDKLVMVVYPFLMLMHIFAHALLAQVWAFIAIGDRTVHDALLAMVGAWFDYFGFEMLYFLVEGHLAIS